MFAVYLFGKISTRYSYASIFRLAYIFAAVAYAFVIFSTPSTGHVTFTIYRFINLFFAAATGVSDTSLLFHITTPEERTSAIALNTMIRGLVAFFTTLAVSPILEFMQKSDIIIFGMKVYAQQILATISFTLAVLLVVYYQIFCRKIMSADSAE